MLLTIALLIFLVGYDFACFVHNKRVRSATLATVAAVNISVSDIPSPTTLPVALTPTVEIVNDNVIVQASESDRLHSLDSQYTIRDLKAICKANPGAVVGYGSLTKAELIARLVSVGLI